MTAEKDGARGRFFLRQFVGVVGVGGAGSSHHWIVACHLSSQSLSLYLGSASS